MSAICEYGVCFWEFLKIENEQKKKQFLWIKQNAWTTNLCVEIMNSKGQVEGKLGHVVQIDLNVSIQKLNWTAWPKSLKQDPFTRWKKKRSKLYGTDLCQPCSVCFRFIFFASGANHVTEPFYLLFLFALWKDKKKTKFEMPRGKRPQNRYYLVNLLIVFKSNFTRTSKVRKNRQQTTCNLFCNIAPRLRAVSLFLQI